MNLCVGWWDEGIRKDGEALVLNRFQGQRIINAMIFRQYFSVSE